MSLGGRISKLALCFPPSRSSLTFTRRYCHVPDVSEYSPQLYLTLDLKLEFERRWKQHVDNFSLTENDACPNTYILSMFPYPSGKLHMGHVRVYTISDSLARFYRMMGHNVLHPMGWDAFGLPAENAAIQNGEDPAVWTENNINIMRSQLKQLGFSFDWDREFATCRPEYYKWTQYIFLQMYKAGLVYRKPSLVNWDPVDKTVLASEQVDEKGNSWRSGAKVEKILLTQWFVRSTKFSLNLLKELSGIHKEDWADVIKLQKSWIGEVNGVTFDWSIEGVGSNISLPVWTDKPEHVYKVGFIAVKPGTMLDVMQSQKSLYEYEYTTMEGNKEMFTAACLDCVACNPFSLEKVPIYVVDGFLPFPAGSDTYMGVPIKNKIDSVFEKIVGLSTQNKSSLVGEETSAESICSKAQQQGFGGWPSSSNLKDWLISRQRYWGTPIPIIHCSACGTVSVPEDQLPVQLPSFPSTEISDSVASPLAQVKDWVNTTCPKCGGAASRETDTMDTFVDSSWYYLRFIDPFNNEKLVGFEKAMQFMPVGIYIGGKEHATLHLYYARIVSHFLHQIGLSPCPEPFKRLLVQGMIMGQTFLEPETGRYLKKSEIEIQGKKSICRETGKPVVVKWDKMSKSKHNGADPAEVISSFGVDSTRLLILAEAAPFSQRNWDPQGSKGVFNWQNNLYVLILHFISIRKEAKAEKLMPNPYSPQYLDGEKQCLALRNKHLSTATHCFKNSHQFMVAIKSMQTLTKQLKMLPNDIVAFSPKFEQALATLISTLAPMAPHFASELWQRFVSAPGRLNSNSTEISWDKPVLEQSWPELDPEFNLTVSINLNVRPVCSVNIPYKKLKGISEDELLQIALQEEQVKKFLNNRTFEVRGINIIPERGASVFLHVHGLKGSEIEVGSSSVLTKKEKQALAKKKKLTEAAV